MKHVFFTPVLAAAMALLGGCNGNSTANDVQYEDEQAAADARVRVEEARIEQDEMAVEAEEKSKWYTPWNWGDDKDKQEAEARAAEQPGVQAEYEEPDKYAEFAVKEKKESTWYNPFSWFGDDEQQIGVEVDEDQVKYEDEDYDGDDEDAKPKRITKGDVLGNLSPELHSLAETKDEGKLRVRHSMDTNMRGIHDDVRMFLLLDRPGRLSLYPIP